MLSGAREAGCFREVAALHSDHLRQVPLYLPFYIKSTVFINNLSGYRHTPQKFTCYIYVIHARSTSAILAAECIDVHICVYIMPC